MLSGRHCIAARQHDAHQESCPGAAPYPPEAWPFAKLPALRRFDASDRRIRCSCVPEQHASVPVHSGTFAFRRSSSLDHGILFDHARTARIGLPEAVFCEGKPREALLELLHHFGRNQGHPILFTRLEEDIFRHLPADLQARYDYHALSRTAFGERMPDYPHGQVAVVSAGTADGFVTWEAARTLTYLGIRNTVFEDCGVAGLWRLADRIPGINAHDVIIVVAGLDAALASVVGGLTPRPVFCVPTSVGYGVAGRGTTALNSMLASCAPGLGILNIDNGYGAACAAARVLHAIHGLPEGCTPEGSRNQGA